MKDQQTVMELSRLDPVSARPASALADAVTDKDVDQAMLRWAIDNRIAGQLTVIVPISVIAIAANDTPQKYIFWGLLALQMIAQFMIAASSLYVQHRLKNGLPPALAITVWTGCEALAGSVWGMMMIPTTASILGNMAAFTICIALSVTVTASCLMSAPATRLVHGFLIGFSVTMAVQLISFSHLYGLYPSIGIVGFILALFMIVTALKRNAHVGERTSMENRLLTDRLEDALQVAEYLSRHDSLTGLLNRRDFERRASELLAAQQITGTQDEMAIILIDIDHFKAINDRHGHAAGDEVLLAISALLKDYVRSEGRNAGPGDAIARWGGEEFILLLTECSVENAKDVAGRIRDAVQKYDDPILPEKLNITVSLGVSAWAFEESLGDAISRADDAMYSAKAAGRNRVHGIEQAA